MAPTYEDLISAVNSASAAVGTDSQDLAAVQSKLASDSQDLAAKTAARNQAVISGPASIVVDNGDGTYAIYESDTGGSVVVKSGITSKTPLPGSQAQADPPASTLEAA